MSRCLPLGGRRTRSLLAIHRCTGRVRHTTPKHMAISVRQYACPPHRLPRALTASRHALIQVSSFPDRDDQVISRHSQALMPRLVHAGFRLQVRTEHPRAIRESLEDGRLHRKDASHNQVKKDT